VNRIERAQLASGELNGPSEYPVVHFDHETSSENLLSPRATHNTWMGKFDGSRYFDDGKSAAGEERTILQI